MSKEASNENLKTGPILGIDLGTTNSCVAIMEGGSPKVLENRVGGRTTPSVAAFNKVKGIFVVGVEARRQLEDKVTSIKRKMGDPNYKVKLGEKEYTPEQVSAMILRNLVDSASEKLGKKITRAVVTVPAYFNDEQRKATRDAGKIAGLEVERILNEPTAAALAYGLDRTEKEQTILVYDLGGGTFDVSILHISKGKEGAVFETRAVDGINELGGDDFDKKIFDYAITKFKKETGIDLLTEGETEQDRKVIRQRLMEASEEAKKELSGSQKATISLLYIIEPKGGRSPHVEVEITRAEFEEITREYMERTAERVEKALEHAKLTKNDIQQIVLVGGSTRMPMVEKLIKEKFGEKKINKSVNPDEVVAIGAAIQGGILMGDVKDVLLLDVTPLSLGIKTQTARDAEATNTVLIPRNTTIPTQKSQIFSTAEDNQTSVHIQVLQGERPRASDNKILGSFELSGIEPAPRGVPQIEVTLEIDANGILKVTAADLQSKKKESLTVKGGQGLSKEEIERMVREAEENKTKDEEWKSNQELLNRAQTYCHTFAKQIEDFKKHKNFKEDDPQFQEFKKLYDNLKEVTKTVEEMKEENEEKKEKYLELKRQINKIDELIKLSNELMQKMPKEEDKEKKDNNEEDIMDVKPEKERDDDKK